MALDQIAEGKVAAAAATTTAATTTAETITTAAHPSVQADGGGVSRPGQEPPEAVGGHAEAGGNVLLGRSHPTLRLEGGRHPASAPSSRRHRHGQPDGAGGVGERPLDGLPDPPARIRAESETAGGVILLRATDEAKGAFLDEVPYGHAATPRTTAAPIAGAKAHATAPGNAETAKTAQSTAITPSATATAAAASRARAGTKTELRPARTALGTR